MLKIKNSYSIEKSMTPKLVMAILLCIFFAGCSSLNNSNSQYDRGTVKVSKKSKAKARAKAKAKAEAKQKAKAQARTETKPKTNSQPKAQTQTQTQTKLKPKTKPETKLEAKPKLEIIEAKPKVETKPKPIAKAQNRPKFKPKAPTKYKAKTKKAKPKRPKLDQLNSNQLDSVYVKGGIEPVSKNSKKENQVRDLVQKNEKQHADVPDLHIKPTNIKPDQGINIPTNLDSNVRGEVEIEASLIN